MNGEMSAYGLWFLVGINAAIFILFAFSFTRPRTRTDWRSFGAYSAFVIAFFGEMYGFPLTLYLLAGWLGTRYPGLDPLSHEAGHIWPILLGWPFDPHWSPFQIASMVFILGGFMLIATAWRVLHAAQRTGELATTGPYTRMRHPQYVGFVLVMFGFLLQWPTLLTLTMFPLLVWMYARLAISEEREMERQFGSSWKIYSAQTPRFIPSPRASFRG